MDAATAQEIAEMHGICLGRPSAGLYDRIYKHLFWIDHTPGHTAEEYGEVRSLLEYVRGELRSG